MIVFYLTLTVFKALHAFSYLMAQDPNTTLVSEPFDFTKIVIYIVLGFSVLLNIALLFYVMKKNSKSRLPSSETNGNYDDYYRTLDSSKNALIEENNNLKIKISSLQNKDFPMNEVDREVSSENRTKMTMSSPAIDQSYEDETPNIVDLTIATPDHIYLPSPFEENRFSVEDSSNERTSSSLYQIILNPSQSSGKLFIIESADFTRALNSPDHYLKKACIYENMFSPKAKGIEVVQPGMVKLENQDWLITEKVKIKFK